MKRFRQSLSVAMIALSNTPSKQMEETFEQLEAVFENFGFQVLWASNLYDNQETDQEKASRLMEFYQNDNVQAIFDVSGGDLANGVLPYIDYNIIKANPKPFFGYSDLSVVVNGIYAKTNQPTYLYQIRNLVGAHSVMQQQAFKETFIDGKDTLFSPTYDWIQGEQMSGEVVGGNIRCFLKLAGTPFLPDFNQKILLLESYSGDVAKMITFLNQYKQMGVFEQINGLIVGSFSEMEQKQLQPDIVSLVQRIIDKPDLPIVKTFQIGHGSDSKCAIIGEVLTLKKEG